MLFEDQVQNGQCDPGINIKYGFFRCFDLYLSKEPKGNSSPLQRIHFITHSKNLLQHTDELLQCRLLAFSPGHCLHSPVLEQSCGSSASVLKWKVFVHSLSCCFK